MNATPDAAGEGAAASRVERASARARDAAAWAKRRVPGAQVVLMAAERERLAAAGLLAGGIAYRLFLWLLPLGVVIAALVSFWVEEDEQGAVDVAEDFGIGAVAAHEALDAIQRGAHTRWYFLLLGIPLLLWFSAGVVRALRIAFSVAWRLRPERLRRPLNAALAFNGVILGVAALSVGAAWAREQAGAVGLLLTLLLVVVYLAVAVSILGVLPHADVSWKALLPGAVLVAVGVQALHLFVVLYLAPKIGRSSELYGSLGAATVLLLWLYLIARLLVAAAFLNAALWHHRVSELPTPSGAPETGPTGR